MTLTYARFLLLFVALPLGVLLFWNRRVLGRLDWKAMGLMLAVVYVAASLWDNQAVKGGLWDFDPDRIWGLRLFWVPLEEYLFFGLQTLFTGTWVLARLHRLREEGAG